ncbi:putative DCC family thiol-disulfide oxidoreductase YuxK [Tenacibaculum skagerrakense]|uniref:Putative DCC family thiol-disulfide oxidoreductase YuxK n=1 Tax=Tenacibaculum skagerrakense TaxID=186571 RepID=A0A4R2NS74_9FLAO|nr:thiol-disulfide oxidoreductase DCC family protein [Tenacibaculum skagerrakense]TCP24381.1 putative DCC family thiol-disulfide oxidoreductase YuxK [Tenacibaculum skagerrakense]
MIEFPENKKIILFDGVCNLCNQTVLRIIKLDKKDTFRFTSLQSETGKEIIDYLKIDTTKVDSIILFEPNQAYYLKSTAALKIFGNFGGIWEVSKFLLFFPSFIRDFVYDIIAKNRYKWFGKKNQCMIPTPELLSKFLD